MALKTAARDLTGSPDDIPALAADLDLQTDAQKIVWIKFLLILNTIQKLTTQSAATAQTFYDNIGIFNSLTALSA